MQNAQTRENKLLSFPAVPSSLSHSAGFLLNRAGGVVREMVVGALAPYRLSPRHVGVMRILASEGQLTQQLLGRKHNIDRTTTVQVIDELESRQLVARIPNIEDRRSHLIHLTPRGKKTLSRAVKAIEKVQARFLTALTQEEWEAMRCSLIKLLDYHQGGKNE